MPPSSSVRSSMLMAGSIRASDRAISSGGMQPMIASWIATVASTRRGRFRLVVEAPLRLDGVGCDDPA